MAAFQVTCVNVAASADRSHNHITHLGIRNSGGFRRRIAVAEAVNQLRSQFGDRYYTVSTSTGRRADVVVGGCEVCGQRPYVRTTADGIYDNNLVSLPNCVG